MKRIVCLVVLCSFLLSGCGIFGQRLWEPVTFYYLQSDYPYGADSTVFGTEEREAAGHRDDLSYLMALYLMGPSDEKLRHPLPRGTRIYTVEHTPEGVLLHLSDTEKNMTETEFTLACACLALTCMDLTDAQSVTVTSGQRTLTMARDGLILFDNSTSENTEDTK